jgi:hypothetical protein
MQRERLVSGANLGVQPPESARGPSKRRLLGGGCLGCGFLGALRSVTQLAEPQERAALLSAGYVVSYLAFSVPALVAGVLATNIGLLNTRRLAMAASWR